MFLKEIFSIIAFSVVTLVFSGFAIKVDKFAYTSLNNNEVDIPMDNFKKLKLEKNPTFNYFEDKEKKSAKIGRYFFKGKPPRIEYVRLFLDIDDTKGQESNSQEDLSRRKLPKEGERGREQSQTAKSKDTKIIKYFVETKSFWANFFC